MEGQETRPLFAGNLDETPFPKLLNEICSMGISGILTVERGKVRKSLIFDHGKPARVTSNLLQEVLGRYLVSIGKINQEQYDREHRRRLPRTTGFTEMSSSNAACLTGDELGKYLREHSLKSSSISSSGRKGSTVSSRRIFMSSGSDFSHLTVESIVFMGIKRYYSLDRLSAVIEPYGGDYLYPGSKTIGASVRSIASVKMNGG